MACASVQPDYSSLCVMCKLLLLLLFAVCCCGIQARARTRSMLHPIIPLLFKSSEVYHATVSVLL